MKTIACLIVALMLGHPAWAQGPPAETPGAPLRRGVLGIGVEPGPVPRLVLIQNDAVLKALKLTEKQKQQIAASSARLSEGRKRVSDQFRERLKELGYPAAGSPELQELRRNARTAEDALRAESESHLLKILEPRQRTRLDQVQLQAEGPMAFTRPEIWQRLNLAPEQVEAIQLIVADARERMNQTSAVPLPDDFQRGPASPESERALFKSKDFRKGLESSLTATIKVRKATTQKILKLLTKRQRANYEKLLGEPFDLAKLRSEAVRSLPSDQPKGTRKP